MLLMTTNLLSPNSTPTSIAQTNPLSYVDAIFLRNETHWRELSSITVQQAVEAWLSTLRNPNTRDAYFRAIAKSVQHNLIDLKWTLQELALCNGEAIIDRIKQFEEYSEATRQARAAAMISLIRFLNRRSQNLIQRILPSREGTTKTFYKVRDQVATLAMTQAQWIHWLGELEKINRRDWIIARLTLQGGKRISETLALTSDRIDPVSRRIRFLQSKTKGIASETVITYPETVLRDLLEYLGSREGLVFVTRSGQPVNRNHIARTFVVAGQRARIPFKITPHTLRASCITFLRHQGFSDSDIMRVSGHASSEMIAAYDRRGREENASSKVNLVT